MRGIEAQFLALQKGFTELIPQHLLKPFDHKELEVRTMSVTNKPAIRMNREGENKPIYYHPRMAPRSF